MYTNLPNYWNRRAIMCRAWEIYRADAISFSESLRRAWAEEKAAAAETPDSRSRFEYVNLTPEALFTLCGKAAGHVINDLADRLDGNRAALNARYSEDLQQETAAAVIEFFADGRDEEDPDARLIAVACKLAKAALNRTRRAERKSGYTERRAARDENGQILTDLDGKTIYSFEKYHPLYIDKCIASRPAAPEPAAVIADIVESTRAIDANAPEIVTLTAAGYTQSEIADALKLKQYQVSRILAKVRAAAGQLASDAIRHTPEQDGTAAAAEL